MALQWRKWAEKTLSALGKETPTLHETMQKAEEANGGGNWLDRIIGSVQTVLPGAISAAKGALAQLSYSGSTGNFQSALENITLSAKFQPIVEQAPAKVGSPLYQSKYINTLSGFVQCQAPVFHSTTALAEEESAIEELLAKGIFFE